MADVHDQKRRSVEPYLKFLRRLDADVSLDTRMTHVLDEFEGADFAALSETLADAGVTAGVSVPAIHVDRRKPIRTAIRVLAEEGHEILLHGYRHTSYMEVGYETAHEELSRSMEVLSSAIGRSPDGLHVPYAAASEGTIAAASDLGVEWIVGSAPDETDADLSTLQPVRPYDLQRLERGLDPAAVFEGLAADADEGSVLLVHPNVHVRPETAAAFTDWLADESFATPGEVATDRTAGPALLLDCFPPFRIA